MKREPRYATEAALCADFISWARNERTQGRWRRYGGAEGWTTYAETAGWDILLVSPDGLQVGVQAKLRANLKVFAQALPSNWDAWRDDGPDFRAILIPERDEAAEKICAAVGLLLFAPTGSGFEPGLDLRDRESWHYWSPRQRCKLPEFVPDVIAGASGPVQLTTWKVAALRIVATLEVRGYVTRQDFRRHQVDPRRWTGPSGWLIPGATPGQFARGPSLDFDQQHPVVFAEVLAEVRQQLERVEAVA